MTDPVLQAALQLVNAGRLEEAMPRLAQVLARDPDQPQALRAMMYVHAVRGRYAEALACAARALARTPADPHLLYRTGQVRTLAGDPAGAIECYQRALAADPTHLESHQALSNQFFVGVFYDEAIARAEAGLRIHRTDPGLIQNRAAALTQSGRAREAMEALKAATKMHPRNAVLAGALATTTNYTEVRRRKRWNCTSGTRRCWRLCLRCCRR